jgi:hypothetical protein
MLIKFCLPCKFHEISEEGNEKKSRCVKENCYAEFSKCIAKKALHQFLEDEKTESKGHLSALNHTFSHK